MRLETLPTYYCLRSTNFVVNIWEVLNCVDLHDYKNKAGYTAIPVADGWAGAEMRVFTLLDLCIPTDQWTDGQTDGRLKVLTELRVRN